MKICFALSLLIFLGVVTDAQITVYLAGDSTCANKAADKRPETGWGEMLQQYFDPAKVRIMNEAQNGRSTKSFIDEGCRHIDKFLTVCTVSSSIPLQSLSILALLLSLKCVGCIWLKYNFTVERTVPTSSCNFADKFFRTHSSCSIAAKTNFPCCSS